MTYNAELTNAELSEFVRVHNAAIARHDQWLTDITRILEETAHSQARTQALAAQTQAQQEINTQEIANLRASILDLRNMVADYIQSRERTEE